MEDTLSFAGHQSFPFRNTWLTKGVSKCAEDPGVFTREDAIVILGVGKNMVDSIRHWCLATQMLEEDPTANHNRGRRLCPTPLASNIFLGDDPWDPYLEDVGTLWLIHWLLATNRRKATTWFFAFNELRQAEFTRSSLERALSVHYQGVPGVRFTRETLKRDVDVFIRTYSPAANSPRQSLEDSIDCPLVELRLLTEQPAYGLYAFIRGPKDTLPDAVFLYALRDFTRGRTEKTLSFNELEYDPLSPGRVFKLDEASLAERLDRVGRLTGSAWEFSETSGLKQLLMKDDFDALAFLSASYRRASAALPGVA